MSLFTEALLRSLRGAASDDPEEGKWRVTTARLQEAIDHFMRQPIFSGEVAGVQIPVAGELPVFELHHLTNEPEVPVYVGCEPEADNAHAEFICLFGNEEKARRALAQVDPEKPTLEWALSLPHGDYIFRAEFAASGPRVSKVVRVRPIHRRVPLRAAP